MLCDRGQQRQRGEGWQRERQAQASVCALAELQSGEREKGRQVPGKVRHFGRDGPEADAGRRDASARAVPCPEREDGYPRLPRR